MYGDKNKAFYGPGNSITVTIVLILFRFGCLVYLVNIGEKIIVTVMEQLKKLQKRNDLYHIAMDLMFLF